MVDITDCRMNEVLRRTKKIRHLQENHLLAGLFFACTTLIGCLFGTIVIITKSIPQSGIIIGTYGTVLLHSGVGAYVLVGLMAFVAGVIITVLCIRMQQKNKSIATKQNHKDVRK